MAGPKGKGLFLNIRQDNDSTPQAGARVINEEELFYQAVFRKYKNQYNSISNVVFATLFKQVDLPKSFLRELWLNLCGEASSINKLQFIKFCCACNHQQKEANPRMQEPFLDFNSEEIMNIANEDPESELPSPFGVEPAIVVSQAISSKSVVKTIKSETEKTPKESKTAKVVIELERDPELNFFYKMNDEMVAMYASKVAALKPADPREVTRKEIGPLAKSSKLPMAVLKKLWYLCDRRSAGTLLHNEAVVYLHYIRMVKGGLPAPRKMLSDLNVFINTGLCPAASVKMDKETMKIRQEQLVKAAQVAKENEKFKTDLGLLLAKANAAIRANNERLNGLARSREAKLNNLAGEIERLKSIIGSMARFKKELVAENASYSKKLEIVDALKKMSGDGDKVDLIDVFQVASRKIGMRVKNIAKLGVGSVEIIKKLNSSKMETVALKEAKVALEDEIDELRRLAEHDDESVMSDAVRVE